MSVVEARVDERLIHGQVVEGWIPMLHVQRVVVVARGIDRDPMRRSVFELSVPPGVQVETWSPEQAPSHVNEITSGPLRTLLIFDGPASVIPLVRAGLTLSCLTLGNLHGAADRHQISKGVAIGPKETAALEILQSMGVEIQVCCGCRDSRKTVAQQELAQWS